MKKIIITIFLTVLLVLLGSVTGYTIGKKSTPTAATDSHHITSSGAHGKHQHKQVEASTPYPTVDLVIHKDAKSGWNAQVLLNNFTFAPESVSSESVPGEGHAHIYIDGEKINRVYSEWYHLGELTPGAHEIAVRLSSNDHKELLAEGALIEDKESVIVAGSH